MHHSLMTRALVRADLPAIATILDATGLFPAELLPAMVAPFLSGAEPHFWLVIVDNETIFGFSYCEPERMTDNTYNLLAIAVLPDRQHHGVGKQLLAATERLLCQRGGRILLVETSALDEYRGTRAFYDGQNFHREAVIRDYYAASEDKIVFWKKL